MNGLSVVAAGAQTVFELPVANQGGIQPGSIDSGELDGDINDGRFEPKGGKGAVARATLYFLLRYPGAIANTSN